MIDRSIDLFDLDQHDRKFSAQAPIPRLIVILTMSQLALHLKCGVISAELSFSYLYLNTYLCLGLEAKQLVASKSCWLLASQA